MRYFFAYLIAWVISGCGAVVILVSVVMLKLLADAPPIEGELGHIGMLGRLALPAGVFVGGALLMGIGQLIASLLDTAKHTRELVELARAKT